LSSYRVTFVADYFVLSTVIDREPDSLLADEIIAHKANKLIKDMYEFEPLDVCYDVEIEEV
jgi:hypothetical protein